MIIKYEVKTGKVVHTIPESYEIKDPADAFVQVEEDGKLKYKPGDIETTVIGPEVAKDYEDPMKPKKNIHKCKIIKKKEFLFLKDNKKEIKLKAIDKRPKS